MAHRNKRSRSKPHHSSASSCAAEKEAAESNYHAFFISEPEDAEDFTHKADFNHLAATILDQAMKRISARPRDDWLMILDRDLKQHVIYATHTPLTCDDLARRSAKGPGKKPQTGGLWPTTHSFDLGLCY